MDMITLFAILMITVAVGATAMACVHYIIARNEIKHSRELLSKWVANIIADTDRRQLLNGKMATALADRIRDLETYRVHHTDRINELEDMVDLMNTDETEDHRDFAYDVQSESDWIEGRNNRFPDLTASHIQDEFASDDGQLYARGLSRSTDFAPGYHGTMQQESYMTNTPEQNDAELDNITAERRRHVLDDTGKLAIEDYERPTFNGYVNTLASELDNNGRLIRR
jgi:hypothetical protein